MKLSRVFRCLLLLSLLPAMGCAKVGDPLPPIVDTPNATSEFEVVQQGGTQLFLLIPPPPKSVRSIVVYQKCDPAPDAEFEVIDTRDATSLALSPAGTRLIYPVADPRLDEPCTFAVRFRSVKGHLSEFSNSVTTEPGPAPSVPANLKVDVEEDRLVVTWDSPPSPDAPVVGYLVDFSQFVPDNRLVKQDFEFGKEYTVVVQSVSRLQRPLILSGPSAPLTFVPKDVFPPPAPINLQAVAVSGGVQLIWDPVDAKDFFGYRVYRRSAAGTFEPIAEPIQVNRFFDEHPLPGVINVYAVTSLDRSGNESEKSPEASAQGAP